MRQRGIVHRSQLASAGVTNKKIRGLTDRGHLIEVVPDVFRMAGTTAGWQQSLWIGVLRAPSGSAISHRSAARLHHIGRFPEGPVDVSEPGDPHHLARPASIHGTTHLPDHHVTTVEGLRVTTFARTVFDLAGQVSRKRFVRGLPSLSQPQVERALDNALNKGLRHGQAVAMLEELGGRGRGGTALFRALLEERGPGYVATESDLEDLVIRVLVQHGALMPVRLRTVGNTKAPTGRVDFLFIQARVVLEADGRRHHSELLDREHDAWRDLELAASGFVVVRVTYRQLVQDPRRFVRELMVLVRSRMEMFDPVASTV